MMIIDLVFYERIIVWNTLGNHQIQNLKEASTFLRLIEKVRPTDLELAETQFTSEGGQYKWLLPPDRPEYGAMALEREDEEAKSMASALEVAPARMRDAGWLLKLVDQCRRKEVGSGVLHRQGD